MHNPNGAWSVPPSGKTNQFILICKSAKCQRAYWVNSQNLITAPGSTPPHPTPPHPTPPHHASRPVHGSHTVGTCYVKPTIPEMGPYQPLIWIECTRDLLLPWGFQGPKTAPGPWLHTHIGSSRLRRFHLGWLVLPTVYLAGLRA